MNTVYYFIISLIAIPVAVRMAKDRKRDGGSWGLIALVIGWLAVIILACIGEKKGTDSEEVINDKNSADNIIVKKDPKIVNSEISIKNENDRIDLLFRYKKLLDEGIISKEEFETKKSQIINNSSNIVEPVGEKEEINDDKQINNDKAVNEIQNGIILTNKDLGLLKESLQKNDKETIEKIMGKRFYTFKDNSVYRYSILSVDKNNILFCLVEEFKAGSNKSYITKVDSNQESIDINNLPHLYEDSNKIFDKAVETLGIETSEKELKIIKKDLIEK